MHRLNHSDQDFDDNSEMVDALVLPQLEKDLLSCVASGDERAFAELYQLYGIPLYNYLRNLVSDEAVAEDLLQEVFIAVWNGARGFRGESQVKTWIYRIAHNKAVSWFRRNPRIVHVDDPDNPSGEPDLESRAVDQWRNGQIKLALNRLSPTHREVVELAFYHNLSYSEIAAVIGCPVGTVKSRMSYARRSLNVYFQQLGLGTQRA